ncbi:hypothetical protein [Kitasatospora sp. NBC_01539]|uniref:hypothetical protein n=1 Tax=Kitasatospora sp. NBC_01539 TaxID=2903577 RepID=UPI00386027CD
MTDAMNAHRLVDAFFTHCGNRDRPAGPQGHAHAVWRLYCDLEPATVDRLRAWATGPESGPLGPAERTVLLNWLDAREG